MSQGQLRYRGRCADCPWVGRPFIRYGTAEAAARDHARANGHICFVVDQYDLRIAGSTIRW
ncbi:hypothetical protein [Jiangella rhizosphaerae]|uniref:DUF2188 domain-containing protein n=1 Tax=Jiangella rhizosphaerae TaxID=2293569 RepID=A0A418KRC3_9ACTN|nr:hypothetical protein [Jiangella rhizosphaerae]RIQ23209.1 hypothetical protein DY240_12805 [Jiangella rhizosphaerae]